MSVYSASIWQRQAKEAGAIRHQPAVRQGPPRQAWRQQRCTHASRRLV